MKGTAPPILSGVCARIAVRAGLALAILGFVPGLLDPFNAPKAAALCVVGLALLVGTGLERVLETVAERKRSGAIPPVEPLRAGGAPEGFERGDARFRIPNAMDIAVAAWVLVSVLATLAGVSPRLSVLGEIEQREGLLTTLSLAGLYAGTRRSHHAPGHVRATLATLLACATLASAYAMMQVAGVDPLVWANAPTYPAGTGSALRPFATLGNPILLGGLLAPALAAGAARLARRRAVAWLDAPLVMLIAAVIVGTLSRGAWLAAAAGVAVAALGMAVVGGPGTRRRVALALALATLPAWLWNALVLRAPLAARLTEDVHAGALSSPARGAIARGAIALWRAHPWLGTGPDTFALMFPAVQPAALWRNEWIGVPANAHSAALQMLVTLGALGALAGLAWLGLAARALARAWRAAPGQREDIVAIAAALASLAVAGAVNPVGLAGAASFVVLAALVAALAPHGGRERPAPARLPAAPILAAALVAALASWIAARECGALLAAGRSRDALTQSTLAIGPERSMLVESAARAADRAARAAPAEDELWRLECDAELARAAGALALRDLAGAGPAALRAERAARSAMRLEPARASNHQRLGNALAMEARVARIEAGTPPADSAAAARVQALALGAEAAFAGAHRLAPSDALILVDASRANLALGRGPGALAAARAVVALYPEAATGHALEAAALLVLHRRDEARAALRRALSARWEDGSEAEHRAALRFYRALTPPDSSR